MANNYRNIMNGIGVVPKSSTGNSLLGDIEVITSSTKLNFHNGSSNSPMVTEAHASQGANRLQNKDLEASTTKIVDASDTSKKIAAQVSGATTATTTTLIFAQTANRSLTFPDATDVIVARDTTDTLTNKTLTTPVIAQINNGGLLTLPTGPDTLVARTSTDTLTNKTLTSPILNTPTADTITGIVGGALTLQSASGQNVIVNAQGAGSTLLQVAGSTIGTVSSTGLAMATGKVVSLSNNSQTTTLQAHASASASYTISTPAVAPTANTAWVYDGSTYVWATAGGWQNNSNLTLTGGASIAISTTAGQQIWEVQGNSGAVTLSTTPLGSTDPVSGAVVRLRGMSNTNTVTITNSDVANGAILNGDCTLGQGDMIELQYSASQDRWYECFRNN